jgi:hypothetical protein
VFNGPSAQAFAAASAPLISNFGDALTLWRDGNVVHWSYDDQSIVVELQFDGTVEATFFDRPSTDQISGTSAVAQYRRGDRPYRLTPGGAAAMVADMMAFFSGDREPLFSFVGVR